MNPDDVLTLKQSDNKPEIPTKSPITPIYLYGKAKRRRISPYVRFRDLNNGPDTNGDNEPVTSAEVGIRFSF